MIGGKRQRGNAMVEVALMAPWIFFLFVGILDFGFYAYAAICTQSAARVGANYLASDQSLGANFAAACNAALGELNHLPNARSITTCATSVANITDALPVAVEPVAIIAANSVDGSAPAVQVKVTYLSIPMIPIPGLLMSRMQITRVAEMRVAQ